MVTWLYNICNVSDVFLSIILFYVFIFRTKKTNKHEVSVDLCLCRFIEYKNSWVKIKLENKPVEKKTLYCAKKTGCLPP